MFGGFVTELFCENMEMERINALPVLTLAHMGDCVYELLVRTYVIQTAGGKVASVHKNTVGQVSATAQAKAGERLLPSLTEEERGFFMRGRNTKLHSIPKNASIRQYAYATALETLFGILYLNGRNERILELWNIIRSGDEDGEKGI